MFSPSRTCRQHRAAFTLVELITVVGLIALFAGVIGYAFMRGGSASVGLQSSQSMVAGLLTLVRSQAATSGRNAALFVNVHAANPERYCRYLVPVVRNDADNGWVALSDGVFLPAGCYIVPNSVPTNVEAAADWSDAESSALGATVSLALNSADAESWAGISITPRGTTGNSGDLVVANGRPDATGAFVFIEPDNVRGVSISAYGLSRLVNDAQGFK